jgi:hypothetical protein
MIISKPLFSSLTINKANESMYCDLRGRIFSSLNHSLYDSL